MTTIWFNCDRCKASVIGLHAVDMTGGFYVVDGDSHWAKYGQDGEHFVCDDCIQSSPEYRAAYGPDAS